MSTLIGTKIHHVARDSRRLHSVIVATYVSYRKNRRPQRVYVAVDLAGNVRTFTQRQLRQLTREGAITMSGGVAE